MGIEDRDWFHEHRDQVSREDVYNPKHFRGSKSQPQVYEVYEVTEKKGFGVSTTIYVLIAAILIGLFAGLWAAANPYQGFELFKTIVEILKKLWFVWLGAVLLLGIVVTWLKPDWFEEAFTDNSFMGRTAKFLNVRKSLIWLLVMSLIAFTAFKMEQSSTKREKERIEAQRLNQEKMLYEQQQKWAAYNRVQEWKKEAASKPLPAVVVEDRRRNRAYFAEDSRQDRLETAWKSWYKKPAACESGGVTVECANNYIMKRREFERLYAAGKVN